MAIKAYKPTTPAQRGMTTQDSSEITTKKPVRSLLAAKKRQLAETTRDALLPGTRAVVYDATTV